MFCAFGVEEEREKKGFVLQFVRCLFFLQVFSVY